jgi:hypothetical protein
VRGAQADGKFYCPIVEMYRDYKVIFSIFCGREDRMHILILHLEELYKSKLIDEIHLWDYCRNESDRKWLKTLPYTYIEPSDKSARWKSYYDHYYNSLDDKTILIKCDDDVVALDNENFTKFLDFRIDNPQYFLVFPNIVNNGVAAYFQQNSHGVIPKTLMDLEMPNGGHGGSLWSSLDLCRKIHEFFLEEPARFRYEGHHEIDSGIRFSINLFAVMKQHVLLGFKDVSPDDEQYLTVEITKKFNLKNALYNGMYASHLSFNEQDKQGDMSDLLHRYKNLYYSRGSTLTLLLIICILVIVFTCLFIQNILGEK